MLDRNESEDEGVEQCVFRGKVLEAEKWREATVEKVKASIAIGRERTLLVYL